MIRSLQQKKKKKTQDKTRPGKMGNPRVQAALFCSTGQQGTLWAWRGGVRMSSVVARGSLCKLINTIYKWGGEAKEAELGVCGDTDCGEILQATWWGRFAWSREAWLLQALHLRPEGTKGAPCSSQGAQGRGPGQSGRGRPRGTAEPGWWRQDVSQCFARFQQASW